MMQEGNRRWLALAVKQVDTAGAVTATKTEFEKLMAVDLTVVPWWMLRVTRCCQLVAIEMMLAYPYEQMFVGETQ
ncbi:MAG: hypothetical protein P8L85_00025 [Rubripirellula sp.]|nr:hypothetical protein [Rubripirellula sp.]